MIQQSLELLLSPELIIRCLLGFAVGALIGLERQKRMKEEVTLGVRSFGLHSLLGTLAAYSYTITSIPATETTPAVPGNPIILIYATAVSLIIVTFQMGYKIFRTMRKGITTTIVFALAFVLGALVGFDAPAEGQLFGTLSLLSMTISFLVFLVLGFKEELAAAVSSITHEEMISAAELGVLILFLWPIMPQTIQLGPIVFPVFQIYVLVVILLGISFANYILVKKYRTRGSYFFGFFGGFANSEATVTSLTEYYVRTGRTDIDRISLAAILANLAMVLRNGVIVVILDPTLQIFSYYLIPLAILVFMGMFRMIRVKQKKLEEETTEIEGKITSPFSFGAAMRFAVVFTGVALFSSFAQTFFADQGIILAALVGGFASAGAIVAIVVPLFASGVISLSTAVYAVVIATTTSVLNKTLYVYFSDTEMTLFKRVAKDTILMGTGALIYLLMLGLGLIPGL